MPLCMCVCCVQVFKAAGKGWGVRCSVDIPVGAVLCAYTGIIITDRCAVLCCAVEWGGEGVQPGEGGVCTALASTS
jgi:hypothetical protein